MLHFLPKTVRINRVNKIDLKGENTVERKVIDYLIMLGVAAVGIGNIMFSTDGNALETQKQVIMDMNDVMDIEREVEKRKREHEKELYYKGYKIVIKE